MTPDRPEPQNRQREVGQRRQITRSAHGALRRYARMQPRIDETFEEPHQLGADTGESLQETGQLEHQDESDHPVIQQWTRSGAMRE